MQVNLGPFPTRQADTMTEIRTPQNLQIKVIFDHFYHGLQSRHSSYRLSDSVAIKFFMLTIVFGTILSNIIEFLRDQPNIVTKRSIRLSDRCRILSIANYVETAAPHSIVNKSQLIWYNPIWSKLGSLFFSLSYILSKEVWINT